VVYFLGHPVIVMPLQKKQALSVLANDSQVGLYTWVTKRVVVPLRHLRHVPPDSMATLT